VNRRTFKPNHQTIMATERLIKLDIARELAVVKAETAPK
jgi:hypothetical protein